MGIQQREPPASVVAFAPKRAGQERPEQDRTVPADDAGNGIIALLHKAAEGAKEDCARAMDLAHNLSSQLRAAEERSRELEVETKSLSGACRYRGEMAVDPKDLTIITRSRTLRKIRERW